MTIDDIRNTMNASGSHWFDQSSMRFFSTRLGAVYSGPGGVYFVTSEAPPSGGRRYSVRQFTPATASDKPSIATCGPFCVMHRSAAHTAARTLARGCKETADTLSYRRSGRVEG